MNSECLKILETTGFNYTCTEEELKNFVSMLFEMRKKAFQEGGYANYGEKIVAETQIEQIDELQRGCEEDLDLVKAMLKFWSPQHFDEFIRVKGQQAQRTLQQNIQKILSQ